MLKVANLGPVVCVGAGVIRLAAVTFSSQSPVLVTGKIKDGQLTLIVNCEKMNIHSILMKEIKEVLS